MSTTWHLPHVHQWVRQGTGPDTDPAHTHWSNVVTCWCGAQMEYPAPAARRDAGLEVKE